MKRWQPSIVKARQSAMPMRRALMRRVPTVADGANSEGATAGEADSVPELRVLGPHLRHVAVAVRRTVRRQPRELHAAGSIGLTSPSVAS